MNKIILIGRITKEVELRPMPNGDNLCSFTIAVNRNYKDANGNIPTDFIPCVAFRHSANFMGQYVRKGDNLSIIGTLQQRTYIDQNGQNKSFHEVAVEEVNNLTPKPKVENQPQVNQITNQMPNQMQNPLPRKPQPQPTYQQPVQPQVQPTYQPQQVEEDDTLPWL